MVNKNKLVLYHANCNDGWVAALQAYNVLGDEADYKAMHYGDLIPDGYDTIYMLDYSHWPLPECAKVVVLDHHKTAIEAALRAGHPGDYGDGIHVVNGNLTLFIDPNECGATLACEYFGTRSYWLLDYIRDHDLWLFEQPYSKEVRAGLSLLSKDNLEKDAEVWWNLDYDLLVRNGTIVLAYASTIADGLAKQSRLVNSPLGVVRIINTGYDVSAVGHRILELYEDTDVALMWFVANGNVVCSLRSRDVGDPRHIDVALLAQSYSGGGHPCAAGFRLGKEVPSWLI